MLLGDNFYGSSKVFLNGYTLYWDNISGTRRNAWFIKFKGKLYLSYGTSYLIRRTKNRQNFYTYYSYIRRYIWFEHIFFRKYVAEREFMIRLEVEELVRHDSLRFKVIDRRLLKSNIRKSIIY